MGFLRAEFGCTRYYEYQVGVGPEEAVRRAVAFWHALDCEVADYNMTAASGNSDTPALKY